jgi:GDP-L-fucose synthase
MIGDTVLKAFTGKNVLVTGGTGMIGRQVVDLLCGADACVRIVSLDQVSVSNKAEHVFGDLTSFDFCKRVVQGMDYVCHLAGIKGSAKVSSTHLASHFVPTVMFNTNVLEACRLEKVRGVVYASSIGAYSSAEVFHEAEPGNYSDSPMDFAGWAKRVGELQVHAYKVQYGLENFSIVRPCNVYGPGDNFDPANGMVVGSLMGRIARGENPVVVWGDGTAVRDLLYSRDAAEGVLLALYYGTKGRYVNLGSGNSYAIRTLVETLSKIVDFVYVFDKNKPSGFPKRVMDISLAREMIHYAPSTSLEDGLRITWHWFVKNKDEYLSRKNYFKEYRES